MKLIYCTICQDLVKLKMELTYCECEKSCGKYLEDGLNAIYFGDYAVPLGINNFNFVEALKKQPKDGLGKRFEAFIISVECPTFRKEKFENNRENCKKGL